ncbi:MAG: glycosyltransferase family 4 protein [Armatimonadota bacterium]|nr:glycosyltransferase family 4 protein [Armatimonadota bacterium]
MARGGRPWRIAFYDAFASVDGPGMVLLELLQHLDRSRFQPHVVLPREGTLMAGLREADLCPVEVLPPLPPLDAYGKRLLQAGAIARLRAGIALLRHTAQLRRWLRQADIALLHCNQTRAAVQAGPAGRIAGLPVVWNARIRERLPASVVRIAAWSADRIIPLTDDTFSELPETFGLNEAGLRAISTVIPNAIDPLRFHPSVDGTHVREELGIPTDVPVLLSVGVLVPRKGHDVLIRAMPAIRRHQRDARLLIAGGPAEGREHCRSELEELASGEGVSAAVRMLGRRDDVPELLAAADVFVLASRHEGHPAAVLEAMAAGTPVVVTPPAAVAVADGVTGIVVPPDEPEAVAEAVLELLARPERAHATALAARQHVERHHHIREMVRAYERVYLELLEGA